MSPSTTSADGGPPMSWNLHLPTLPEVIGLCPGCNKSIREGESTQLVFGQLFHAEHAPLPPQE